MKGNRDGNVVCPLTEGTVEQSIQVFDLFCKSQEGGASSVGGKRLGSIRKNFGKRRETV